MTDKQNAELVERLNAALGWELRALAMYGHYAAYVKGIHRLHLKPFFEAEATESVGHANGVRNEIVKLGGIARTDRVLGDWRTCPGYSSVGAGHARDFHFRQNRVIAGMARSYRYNCFCW